LIRVDPVNTENNRKRIRSKKIEKPHPRFTTKANLPAARQQKTWNLRHPVTAANAPWDLTVYKIIYSAVDE
jgi:hypothetical protein